MGFFLVRLYVCVSAHALYSCKQLRLRMLIQFKTRASIRAFCHIVISCWPNLFFPLLFLCSITHTLPFRSASHSLNHINHSNLTSYLEYLTDQTKQTLAIISIYSFLVFLSQRLLISINSLVVIRFGYGLMRLGCRSFIRK